MVPVTPVTFAGWPEIARCALTPEEEATSPSASRPPYPLGAPNLTPGAYEVTPKIYEAVSLETKDRFLKDNVTVKKIPQYIVSNDAGGATLIMGMNILANRYVNKVIIGTDVKLDLTQDDITPDKLAEGVKAHDRTGAPSSARAPKTRTPRTRRLRLRKF